MKASDIRQHFLEYFIKQGHTIVPSSSLVPKDDPSLLFTNAGMVQFKNIFLDQSKHHYSRVCTSQKCLRIGGKHNDLENVGRTKRHHTFFEMLGNFSFGDYFKAEAIKFAWTLLIEDLGLDKQRLYITTFQNDNETAELWQKIAGMDKERIFRLGEKDNFWSMGDTGPCGPCSEIHIDQGEDLACGSNCGIGTCDCDRFLEIWNLVFMQYDQRSDGKRVPLNRPSIDTGMGLERIAAVLQGVRSNYESDLFSPIIDFVCRKAGITYHTDKEIDTALQVIADHSRATAFLITDQILPSNEGRGYVLRRLIRRASRFGQLIGLKDPFLYETVDKVVDEMGQTFPNLLTCRDFLLKVVREEEERFAHTLDKGLTLLEEEMASLRKIKKTLIPGKIAFRLYDTYGFPLDIINDLAQKQGFTTDELGFQACMKGQKERARKAWKGSGEKNVASLFKNLLRADIKSLFVGYEILETESLILALLDIEGCQVPRLIKSHEGFLISSTTPFYGESGGQIGDTGQILTLTGEAKVLDVIKASPELTVLKIFIHNGEILSGQKVKLAVDAKSRTATSRNHTCTHMLHAALRNILGPHVKQSGSLIGPDRLRFDFTHIQPLTTQEIKAIEDYVNRAILTNHPVSRQSMSQDAAMTKGATALFGEKYGDKVCVVEVSGVSIELCGGTHTSATGQIGSFVILSEIGIAAGIRRIEAATGLNTINHFQAHKEEALRAATLLKANPKHLAEKIHTLLLQLKELQKEIDQLQDKIASGMNSEFLNKIKQVVGIKVLSLKSEAPNVKTLRKQMDALKSKLPSSVICLIAPTGGSKVTILLSVSKDLHNKFTALTLIKDVAAEVSGYGGGCPEQAQAGGTNLNGIDRALAKVIELVATAG